MKDGLAKIYVSIVLLLLPMLGAWSVPEHYYYFKDENQIVYMPKSADRAFSLDSSGQPVNITNSTIYGYMGTDTRVTFPVYDHAYYYRTGSSNIYVTFDQETFETNLNFLESSNKPVSYENIISALVAGLFFLQLISYNQFRVRKAREKTI